MTATDEKTDPPTASERLSPAQRADIEAQRAETQSTRRTTVPALEEMLYEPLPVL